MLTQLFIFFLTAKCCEIVFTSIIWKQKYISSYTGHIMLFFSVRNSTSYLLFSKISTRSHMSWTLNFLTPYIVLWCTLVCQSVRSGVWPSWLAQKDSIRVWHKNYLFCSSAVLRLVTLNRNWSLRTAPWAKLIQSSILWTIKTFHTLSSEQYINSCILFERYQCYENELSDSNHWIHFIPSARPVNYLVRRI